MNKKICSYISPGNDRLYVFAVGKRALMYHELEDYKNADSIEKRAKITRFIDRMTEYHRAIYQLPPIYRRRLYTKEIKDICGVMDNFKKSNEVVKLAKDHFRFMMDVVI